MFFHKHPYEPFIFEDTEQLIVGTLPPPRFSTGNLLEKDVDFCYGSYYNSLWIYINEIYNLNLKFENTHEAIEQRKLFLKQHRIGVCDIVDSCKREKIDASDLGMTNIVLRDLIGYLQKFTKVHTLLFTGGNSKNGPEYFFRKHLKEYGLKLELVSNEIPRVHQFLLPRHSDLRKAKKESAGYNEKIASSQALRNDQRIIKTVSLTSPSGSANRAIGSNAHYKKRKQENSNYSTFDFRIEQYSNWF